MRLRTEIERRGKLRYIIPGHTPYQAAVVVEEEGVMFTSGRAAR